MTPLSALSSVLLPDPLPPSRATTEPSRTENETSRSTSVTPYQTLRCCTSSIDLLSQISLDHRRILANLLWSSLSDLLTRVEHHDAIGNSHDQTDHVLDHDERDPLLVANAAQKLIELGHPVHAQPNRGFVKQHDLGIANERTRDFDDALLAERQCAGRAVGQLGEADKVQRTPGTSSQFSLLRAHAPGVERSSEQPGPTA